jgi:hypothetical protein
MAVLIGILIGIYGTIGVISGGCVFFCAVLGNSVDGVIASFFCPVAWPVILFAVNKGWIR